MRRLLATLGVAGALLMSVVATAVANPQPAVASDGACTDNVGITIVVDFQELGGGVHVRCAPEPVSTGFEALRQADISYQTTLRFPGFLCKIAGEPGNDPCRDTSPASAYWSYWVAPRGGSWCYSNFGAGNRQPPPGSVEGWSFSLNKTGEATPPPRQAPPAPISGQAPNPLGRADCTAAGAPSGPPRQGELDFGPGASDDGGSAPAPSGVEPGSPSGPGEDPPDAGATPPNPDETTPPSPDTTAPSATVNQGEGEPTETLAGADEGGDESSDTTQADETALGPDGTMDLSQGGSSGGSPIAVLAGGGVAAGLGVAALMAARSRARAATRSTSSSVE